MRVERRAGRARSATAAEILAEPVTGELVGTVANGSRTLSVFRRRDLRGVRLVRFRGDGSPRVVVDLGAHELAALAALLLVAGDVADAAPNDATHWTDGAAAFVDVLDDSAGHPPRLRIAEATPYDAAAPTQTTVADRRLDMSSGAVR